MAAQLLQRCPLLAAALVACVTASSRELPTANFPLEGAIGPDTYLSDATQITCTAIVPPPGSQPGNPTVDQAKAFCSGLAGCGGFVYTTAAASVAGGGSSQTSAVYCTPQSFVTGSQSSTSGVGFVRKVYSSCDLRLSLPATTSYFHGSLAYSRGACAQPSRGTTRARTRSPRPNAARQRAPPRPMVTLSGTEYEVGVDVFRAEADADAASIDGNAHLMQTSPVLVNYYMPGSAHATAGQPIALDGYYPLYPTAAAAGAASTRDGGNGGNQEIGPTTTLALPVKWSLAPHTQTYYMPADGSRRYLGTYPTAFARDGYYPLYRTEADAQTVSTNGAAVSYGPGSTAGHPTYWTTGAIEVFYMPAAGTTRYFGTYTGSSSTGLYGTILKSPVALGTTEAA